MPTTVEPEAVGEQDLIEQVEAHIAGSNRAIVSRGVWLYVEDPAFREPAQGWKIHISARPATLTAVIERMLPTVLARSCHFKIIRSGRELYRLNSSDTHLGGAGKAVTIYSAPGDFVGLARRLADDLVGLSGPRILSDRRVRPDAPVYYRYGPVRDTYEVNDDGDFDLILTDPSGGTHLGKAAGGYWQPPWEPDPFAGPTGPRAAGSSPSVMLGGRYRMLKALSQRGKGGVYRAHDLTCDRPVVIREARAFVDEDKLGRDARARLRNERRVLELLGELDQVPRVLDHFRHDDEEYLVTTDMGALSLTDDVADHGPYRDDPGDPAGRSVARLAERLVAVLDQIHDRGVIIRDLSPKNIVLGADRRPSLVDYEISHVDGPLFHGYTAGYSTSGQERDEPATVEDDYYSLGGTLFFAATGVLPVWFRDDPHNHDAQRAQAILDGRGGIGGTIIKLLDRDPARRRTAMEEIRTGRFQTQCATSGPSYRPSPKRLEQIVDHTLTKIAGYAEDLITGVKFSGGNLPNPTNLYRGSAGIGMELLHHRDRPHVRACLAGLAHWTCGFLTLRRLRPGLYSGEAGTAVFLAASGTALADRALTETARRIARLTPSRIIEHDQHNGVAGVGTGQLLLWHLTGDPSRLDIAARCAERLAADDPARTLKDDPPDYDDCASLSRTLGFAHGLAGTAHFLLMHHTTAGDGSPPLALIQSYELLAEHITHVIRAARSPAAKPMHASFCQGLAGMAATLLRAAGPCGNRTYLDLAREAADACIDLAPRMFSFSQCCGLAGVGELFLDLAHTTGEDEYLEPGRLIAEIILSRAGGPVHAPIFSDHGLEGAWSTGTSGILTFLRRLHNPTSSRLWLDPPATE